MKVELRERIARLQLEGLNLREIGEKVGLTRSAVLRHVSLSERARQAIWRANQKRKIKAQLVEEAGGACIVCGYRKYIGALEFHHTDRSKKEARISRCYSLAKGKREVEKCVLICSNCHKEVEGGITQLPDVS